MTEQERGLYEVLITEALEAHLRARPISTPARTALRPADAADRIALHLGRIIQRAVAGSMTRSGSHVGVAWRGGSSSKSTP